MDMLLSEDLEIGMWLVMIKCNKWIDSLDAFEVPGVYCMKFINYIMRYWDFEMVLDPRTILTQATKTWNPPLCWKLSNKWAHIGSLNNKWTQILILNNQHDQNITKGNR